jgi:hypothetical protein
MLLILDEVERMRWQLPRSPSIVCDDRIMRVASSNLERRIGVTNVLSRVAAARVMFSAAEGQSPATARRPILAQVQCATEGHCDP